MKYFVVFLAVLAVVAADEWKPKTHDEFITIRKECIKEVGLTEEQTSRMRESPFPDEEPFRKYLVCALTKTDVFCTHEGFHAERMAKQYKMSLDESVALELVKGCVDKNEQGSPNDVYVYRVYTCVMGTKIGDEIKAFFKRKMEEAKKSA